MKYLSVAEIADKWGISERSVRNYCAQGRINDAKLIGKIWSIPENAQKPERLNKKILIHRYKAFSVSKSVQKQAHYISELSGS